MKWSVPVLSITRSEYLSLVESEMFIFQTPVNLKKEEKDNILGILKSGRPAVVIASPAGGIDSEISSLLGAMSNDTVISETKTFGTLNYQTEGIFEALPNTFPVWQPFTQNTFTNNLIPVYSVSNSPCLGINQQGGKQLVFWDPPEFASNLLTGAAKYMQSLDLLLGSPVPYVLTARLINDMMRNTGFTFVDKIRQNQPVNLSIWQLYNGSINILAGNLEEGINHTRDLSSHVILNLPQHIKPGWSTEVTEIWGGQKAILPDQKLEIRLDQAQTKLFRFIK